MSLTLHAAQPSTAGRGLLAPDLSVTASRTPYLELDLDRISDIRLMLEVPSTVRAAGLLTSEVTASLTQLADEIELAASAGDLIRYLDADRRFHVELIAVLDNPTLTDLVDRLRRQTRLFGLDALVKSGRLVTSAQEHHTLLATLRRLLGDAAELAAMGERARLLAHPFAGRRIAAKIRELAAG